ncbi:MAG: pilin [bacterium]
MLKNKHVLTKLLSSISLMGIFYLAFFSIAANAQVNNASTFGGVDQKTQTQAAIGVIGKSNSDPRAIVAKVINVLFGFLGLIAVTLILYGGWLWMTSGGNPEKIQHAKDVLKNTAIGLLIIFSAWSVVAFIISYFFQGSGDFLGGAAGGGQHGAGIGGLGNGIIETVYPEPNQTDVARNTGIIVTFREPIDASTICATTSKTSCFGESITQSEVRAGFFAPNVRIYKTIEATNCEKESAIASSSCRWYDATVYSTDGKTFVFKPKSYLGSPSEFIWHTVYLTDYLKKLNGDNAFRSYDTVRDQSWSFEVSNKIDLTPPEVSFGETFPAPDNDQDIEGATSNATTSKGTLQILTTTLDVEAPAVVTAVTSETGPTLAAMATINAACSDSEFKITINNSYATITKMVAGVTTPIGGSNTLSSDNKCLIFDVCGLNLCLTGDRFKSDLSGYITSSNVITGNQWKIEITPATTGDWVQIGNDKYFPTTGGQDLVNKRFKIGLTTALTADNLMAVINGQTDPAFSADRLASTLYLASKMANADANKIALLTSDPLKLLPSAGGTLLGGVSLSVINTTKGRKDKPMNSGIQINFSEAMNPLTLSGSSSQVGNFIQVVNAVGSKVAGDICALDSECLSFKCDGVPKKCVGNYLSGVFKLSNVYKTVEFRSDTECGVNGCGEKIYCLPPKSNIKVWLKSPDLETCATDVDCSTRLPFKTCSNLPAGSVTAATAYKTCQDTASTTNIINYPVSTANIMSANGGLMDSSFNALNGNRDSSANGAVSGFNENQIYGVCTASSPRKGQACTKENEIAICGLGEICLGADILTNAQKTGDNYFFTFWTSSELKIDPPKILTLETNTAINALNVKSTDRVISKFSEVMMSSTLTSGARNAIISTSTIINHKLLNIGAYSGAAVGYWGKSLPQDPNNDGEIETTWAEIAHTDFDPSMKYWSQNGSGINDVYQNCFKPSEGPGIAGACSVTQAQPSCVDGVPKPNYLH